MKKTESFCIRFWLGVRDGVGVKGRVDPGRRRSGLPDTDRQLSARILGLFLELSRFSKCFFGVNSQ